MSRIADLLKVHAGVPEHLKQLLDGQTDDDPDHFAATARHFLSIYSVRLRLLEERNKQSRNYAATVQFVSHLRVMADDELVHCYSIKNNEARAAFFTDADVSTIYAIIYAGSD